MGCFSIGFVLTYPPPLPPLYEGSDGSGKGFHRGSGLSGSSGSVGVGSTGSSGSMGSGSMAGYHFETSFSIEHIAANRQYPGMSLVFPHIVNPTKRTSPSGAQVKLRIQDYPSF